ncbi:MAG TPA: GNAT family N-acetyltransferase [Xanthomonadaceae bacterium]|nr:GNAT family N-acetyltransferase [Xanthomonadaceae bacterium]
MPDAPGLSIEHQADRRRFAVDVDGHEAELDYLLEDGVLAIVHTGVPAAIAGRGIAAALVQAAVDHARQAGLRVRPACTYAAAWMERHPEYAGQQA